MLKIFKRSQNLKLILVLLVAAFLHFFVVSSLNIGETVFDISRFIEFLSSKWFLLTLFITTFFSVFYVRKTSKILLLIFLGTIFVWNFYLFFKDFNKFLMLLSFIFFVVSLYFVGILNFELEEAIYTPNFTLNDLEVRPFHSFKVWLETSLGEEIQGTLTNWDQKGCFFVPNENKTIRPQNLTLKIDFEQTSYIQKGQVVTAFGKGIGIRFNFHGESGSLFNWNDFYKILDDRSYRPKG